MNKIVVGIIGIALAAGVGYFIVGMSQSETREENNVVNNDVMMRQEDSMMKEENDAMMKTEDEMMKEDDAAMMNSEGAAYVAYKDGVVGNGESSVLFFHAAWCPSCKQADTELQEIYSAGGVKLTTYKVDYDTQTDLKKKYGVTYQHTFVVIDGEGNAIKTVTGPTAVQIAALVK